MLLKIIILLLNVSCIIRFNVYDYRFVNINKRDLFILITANAVEFDIDESL